MSKELVIDRSESQVDPRELAARPEPLPLAAPPSIEAILANAVDRGVDVATLKDLMGLHERMTANRARQAFNEAMTAFRRDCPPVERRTINSQFDVVNRNGVKEKRRYASLEDIERTVREHLGSHGLSFRWGSATVADGKLTLACIVSHVGGHSESSSVTLPLESRAGCSEAQKYGAVITYAQRFSLVQALGLTTCDEDTDGNDPKPVETITEHQAANLEALMDDVGADRAKFYAWAGVERISDLPADKFRPAVALLEKKRGGK